MSGTSVLSKRFEEIEEQAKAVEATKHYENNDFYPGQQVEANLLLNWRVKARHLLSLACGVESEHYRQFVHCEAGSWSSYNLLKQLQSVLSAAKEDFDGGYLTSVRHLVQAEVYDSELEQAKGLLDGGYFSAAAVTAGVVLETALRNLCTDQGVPPGKLDRMNADLAKAGKYNLLVQKRITALAEIRNNAAHGHPDQFQPRDVADMISYIETFLSQHLQ